MLSSGGERAKLPRPPSRVPGRGPAAGNMHFSIPETESRSGDSGGSAYVVRSGWSRPGRGGDNGPEPFLSGLRGLAAAFGSVPRPPTPDVLAGSLSHPRFVHRSPQLL